MAKKQNGINPDLEKAISDLLEQTMRDPDVDLEVKLKVIDRAINLEKLKQKAEDEVYGTGFFGGEDA